jgi:hypothetical protein
LPRLARATVFFLNLTGYRLFGGGLVWILVLLRWLTNAFSKKLENHARAVAIHFMYYNFVRIHKTLRVTPAMAAGVTDKLWDVSDIVTILEKREAAD